MINLHKNLLTNMLLTNCEGNRGMETLVSMSLWKCDYYWIS